MEIDTLKKVYKKQNEIKIRNDNLKNYTSDMNDKLERGQVGSL